MIRLAVLFSAAILAYDAVAAAIAKALTVSFDSFLIPGLVLFVLMGVVAGRKARSWAALAPVAVAAAADSTLGWYIAGLLVPSNFPNWSAFGYVLGALDAFALSAFLGAVGIAVGLRVGGAR